MVFKTVVLLTILSLVNANVFKKGFEYIFSYDGQLKIGTEKLSNHFSYIKIVSDVHIKPLINSDLWIWFENVNCSVFAGSKNDNDRYKRVLDNSPIPGVSKAFTLPFVYHGYSNHSMNGISSKLEDQNWSRYMKQAMATLLRLDEKVFEVEPQAFLSNDGFHYYVLNQNDLKVIRMKSEDMKIGEFSTHISEQHIDLQSNKKHVYNIVKNKDNFILNHLKGIGTVYYSPFNGEGDVFYVQVEQRLQLKDHKLSNVSKIKNDQMMYGDFDLRDLKELDEVYRINMVDSKPNIEMLKRKLKELAAYLNVSHLTLSKLTPEGVEYVDHYTHFLKVLKENHLKEIYSMVSNDDDLTQLFLKLVSLTGESDSYIFIVNLITEGNISEQLSIQLLENMAAHPANLSKILNDNLLRLIKRKSSFAEKIRRQTVLCLTSLVPDTSIMHEQIIRSVKEHLIQSQSEEDQLLYIYALRNINAGKMSTEFNMMIQAAGVYKNLTTHARSQAMYGLQMTSEEEKYLWLLLEDRNAEFEVRATALHILTDRDFSQNYERAMWFLIDENDDNIQHLLYTKLKSISETTLPSFAVRRTRAKQLLSQVKKLRISYVKASTFIYDFFDEAKGIGNSLQVTYYGNLGKQNFTHIHIRVALQTSTPRWEQHDWYIHLQRDSNKRVKFNNLFDLVEDSNYEGVTSSIIKVKDGHVVFWHDHTIEDLIWMLNSFHINNYFADITQKNSKIVSYDMGIPVIFEHHRSFIFRIESHFERASLGKFSLNFFYRGIETYGFTSYNSMMNLRNGIKRVQSFDGNFPLDIDFDVEPVNSKMNMTLNIRDEPFGFQSFSHSSVFVEEDSEDDILSKTCPKCKNFNIVTRGEEKLNNLVLLEADLEDFGLQYKLTVFDCEKRLTASYFPWGGKNLVGKLLGLVVPPVQRGMCGIGLKIQKSLKYPATHLDIIIQEGEISTDRTVTWSRSTVNVSYSIKHENRLLKLWNFDAEISTVDESKYEVDLKMRSTKDGILRDTLWLQANDIWLKDRMNAFRKLSFNNSITTSDFIILTTATPAFEEAPNLNLEETFTICDTNIQKTFEDCLREVSSYRAYSSVVCYSHLNVDQIYYLEQLSDFFKLTYPEEFVRMKKRNSTSDCFTLMSSYAPHYDSVNVTVITPEETYRYDDIYLGNFYRLPHVAPYSKLMLYNYVKSRYCEVTSNRVTDAQDGDEYELEYDNDGWARLSAQCNVYYKNCRWLVKTRKINGSNDLMLHFQVEKDTVEISYRKGFQIVYNGKTLAIKEFNILTSIGAHMDIMVMSNRKNKVSRVIIRMKKDTVIAEYTRSRVRLSLPWHLVGKCYIEV